MTRIDKKTLSGLMALAVFISGFAGYSLQPSFTAYYCESRDLVCIGSRLSDTGKSCYYLSDGTEKRAVCKEGWTVYSPEASVESKEVEIYANSCLHVCTYQETLESYTLCYCDDGRWAYAGELI